MSALSLTGRLRKALGETREAERRAGQVEGYQWFRWLARGGLCSRGLIYLLLAYLALDIALHGSAPAATSSEGALQEVAAQPGGRGLLVALTAGLAAYGLWRLAQAVTGKEKPAVTRSIAVRAGWLWIAGLYIVLCVHAVVLTAGGSPGGSRPQAWAARALGWPGGQVLLGAVGVGALAGGVALAVWGIVHDYERQLQLGRLRPAWCRAVKVLGAAGDAARGFLVGMVGVYVLAAAADDRPSQVKTVDLALRSLAHHHDGAVLIGVVASGLLCFALYSLCEAALRQL